MSEQDPVFKKKQEELFAVVNFLIAENLKVHKGVIDKMSSLEYFRGVNFHVLVMKKAKEIKELMPSWADDKKFKLVDLDDSIKLG